MSGPVSTAARRGHAQAAAGFLVDADRAAWHDRSLWFMRQKRDRGTALPEWESLRLAGSALKAHAMSRLADLLEEFERRATANGVVVHWARDAAEHNAIVLDILHSAGVSRVSKSKSMLTEECALNPFLEARGIEVVDTDLGERIVQLRGEMQGGFSTLRTEMRELGGELRTEMRELGGELRTEMHELEGGLRTEMHELEGGLRTEMRGLEDRLRTEMRTLNDETCTQMRVLHEEVISRMALQQEGMVNASPARGSRRPRKTR